MKESNTLAVNAAINFLQRDILQNTKKQYIKDSNTLADNAEINLLRREILLNTKGKYMKESNTLANNAVINLLQREVSLSTKRQYMKKPITLVSIAINILTKRVILQDIKRICIKISRPVSNKCLCRKMILKVRKYFFMHLRLPELNIAGGRHFMPLFLQIVYSWDKFENVDNLVIIVSIGLHRIFNLICLLIMATLSI